MKSKKSLCLFTFLFLIIFISAGCDDTCGTCRKVTYDSGGSIVKADSYTEYCGLDLLVIEATEDVVIGGNTTTYECY